MSRGSRIGMIRAYLGRDDQPPVRAWTEDPSPWAGTPDALPATADRLKGARRVKRKKGKR